MLRMTGVYLAFWLSALGAAPAYCDDPRDVTRDEHSSSITTLLKKVVPSVVAIKTVRVISPAKIDRAKAGQASKIERAEGSGFIVSPDGFIVTNKHVVHGAYNITVALADEQVAQAGIVYESPVIDIALLKVETGHPLLAATLAPADALELGQRVVAIGNPEGLGISASAGIVSALDRNLKTSPYDRYIQTDAAINPGNSGGPLFDLDGQVVGMNSISWTAREGAGSDGLGFAIPVTSIAFLVDQLKKDGHIRCGTLGLKGQKLTAAMKDALGFPGRHGVLVATVEQGSAAAQAGLQVGDVIEGFDGQKLSDITVLNHAACFALKRPVSMEAWRNGQSIPVHVVMNQVEDIQSATDKRAQSPPRFAGASDLGMTLAPVDDRIRRRYALKPDVTGFVVTAVSKSSEAEAAGLGLGDVIKRLQKIPLSVGTSFDNVFATEGQSGQHYLIALVETKGGDRWVTLPVRFRSTQAR